MTFKVLALVVEQFLAHL